MAIKSTFKKAVLTGLLVAGVVSPSAFASSKERAVLDTILDKKEGEARNTSVSISPMSFSSRDSDVKVAILPLTVKTKLDQWTLKATVSYISMTGPGMMFGGAPTMAGMMNGGGDEIRTEKGLADSTVGLSYAFHPGRQKTFVNVSGELSLPTGDKEKRLGTGRTDFTSTLSVTQMYGDAYFNVKPGRVFRGPSTGRPVRDTWQYSLGMGYKFSSSLSGGLSYEFSQALRARDENVNQVTAYVGYKMTSDLSGMLYLGAGLSKESPTEISTGFGLSYKFGG